MKGPSLPKLAWRNLWRQKRRTGITLASIIFGFFLAILMTSMQDRNFADMVDLAAKLGGGHVVVQNPDYLDAPSLKHTLLDGDEGSRLQTREAVLKRSHRITGQIMIATARQSTGGFFIAYDPKNEDATSLSFLEGIKEGRLFETADEKSVVLGHRLAQNLGVKEGGKVVYTLMDKAGEIVTGMGRLRGTIGTGAHGVDSALVLLPITTLRKLLGYQPTEVTQLALFLGDSRKSAAVAKHLNRTLPPGSSRAYPWYEINPDLKAFIAMKVGGAWVMIGIIALLICAGIFNTIFVSVMERTREFGILLAIGFEPRQLFSMVMWESLWLATVGLLGGVLLTAWPYTYLAEHGIDISAQLGDQAMDVAGVGFSPILHVGIYPENAMLISGAVVVTTLLAGLYPAWRAGRVVPVDSINLN